MGAPREKDMSEVLKQKGVLVDNRRVRRVKDEDTGGMATVQRLAIQFDFGPEKNAAKPFEELFPHLERITQAVAGNEDDVGLVVTSKNRLPALHVDARTLVGDLPSEDPVVAWNVTHKGARATVLEKGDGHVVLTVEATVKEAQEKTVRDLFDALAVWHITQGAVQTDIEKRAQANLAKQKGGKAAREPDEVREVAPA